MPLIPPHARARATDPETSHWAAASLGDLRNSQTLVLSLLKAFGPMTDSALIERARREGLPMSESGLRTRRSELVTAGLVVDTGEKALTPSGRHTVIWKAV